MSRKVNARIRMITAGDRGFFSRTSVDYVMSRETFKEFESALVNRIAAADNETLTPFVPTVNIPDKIANQEVKVILMIFTTGDGFDSVTDQTYTMKAIDFMTFENYLLDFFKGLNSDKAFAEKIETRKADRGD